MGKASRRKKEGPRQRPIGSVDKARTEAAIDPRMVAAIDMLRRTGLSEFELRYQDDHQPVVWMAVGKWNVGIEGRPVASTKPGTIIYDAGAALDPVRAVFRLCDQVLTGGVCTHCHRPTGFEEAFDVDVPLAEHVCWQQYDPELKTFRRSCEDGSDG